MAHGRHAFPKAALLGSVSKIDEPDRSADIELVSLGVWVMRSWTHACNLDPTVHECVNIYIRNTQYAHCQGRTYILHILGRQCASLRIFNLLADPP